MFLPNLDLFHIIPIFVSKVSNSIFLPSSFQGGWTALMWGCYKGRLEVVLELLERGANPNIKGEVRLSSFSVYLIIKADGLI